MTLDIDAMMQVADDALDHADWLHQHSQDGVTREEALAANVKQLGHLLTAVTAERDAHLLQVARLEMQLQAKQDALELVIRENTANVAALAEIERKINAYRIGVHNFGAGFPWEGDE